MYADANKLFNPYSKIVFVCSEQVANAKKELPKRCKRDNILSKQFTKTYDKTRMTRHQRFVSHLATIVDCLINNSIPKKTVSNIF